MLLLKLKDVQNKCVPLRNVTRDYVNKRNSIRQNNLFNDELSLVRYKNGCMGEEHGRIKN